MLVIMLTALYVVVRAAESISVRLGGRPDPVPYMVNQPLPWQIHSVSHRRRSSRMDEFDGYRRNSIGVFRKNQASMAIASASLAIPCLLSCADSTGTSNGASFSSSSSSSSSSAPPLHPVDAEKAAATIQNHFRKLQEKKQQNK